MQRVISELFDRYRDQPILVIGGGPSVTRDLASLPADFRPALVLSANEHGCKQDRFAVDYIVNCDKIHCMRHVPMEGYLRQFRVPIINRWSWADVRLEDWTFFGNSGLTSVAVAAALGGSPIVVLGIDFWATGRHYFWDQSTTAPKQKLYAWQRTRPAAASQPDRRLAALAQLVGDAHIRALSGPLLSRWPKYHPGEQFAPAPVIPYCTRQFGTETFKAAKSFHFGNNDVVPAGTVIKLTKREQATLAREGKLAKVVPAE